MIELFFRNGAAYSGKVIAGSFNGKSALVVESCSRCGGSGQFAHYGVCFRCGGTGYDPVAGKVYTAAHLAKLDADQERASAKRVAEAEKRAQESTDAAILAVPGFRDALNRARNIASNDLPEDREHALGRTWRTIADMANKSVWSEKAAAHLVRVLGWWDEGVVKFEAKAAEKAQKADDCRNWVKAGRQDIEGLVVSTKVKESRFGSTTKMLVEDSAGRRFWGTKPASLGGRGAKGQRVRFTATVECSPDDKLFGFFSRPSKAEYIEVIS